MPVQTRSHGRPAAPSLVTKVKNALTGSTTTKKPRATPKKTTTPRKTTAGVKKRDASTRKTPVVHKHKRKPGLSDKLQGVALKIEGAVTGRPGVKAAGTKKIRGTDGKNSRTPKATRRH